MGYEDYFLIVWDFVLYAKKQGILVGPGRGSAAGSLVAYVLGIVDVDPMAFDLYFERFLNPERITMPDIDMDFPDDKREEVIRYTIDKYGKDRVVSIITFGTFQGKSAIRDVGRVLDVDTVILDELSKNLSDSANSIEVFRETHPKEYSYYMNIDEIKDLMQIAEKLNGLVKHVSTHAAGVIISSEDIRRYTPIQQGLMDAYQTQYEASDLESLGLLKFDFLGLKNLSMIKETLNLIRDKDQMDINIYKIPLDDPATFKLLKDVKTLGVFQLESRGMMDLVANMQIETFEDIATCISLFRPGPMENIPAFLRRRRHEESISYPHIDLQPILASTNGIIIYQEQIMAIANRFSGYSLGEADVLRRAVSKKKRSILENERKKFIRGAKQKGYPERVANDIYDYIVKFANYGFNKSHAVAYAMVGYWMAYLKANYSNHFMSVLLNAQIGSATGTRRYAKECQRLGIGILPPRINLSSVNYVPENGNLRYPIQGIKGIGPKAAEQIVEIQIEKPVEDLIDFVMRRRGLAINVLEAMIYAGMFDEFNLNKRTMIENLPRLLQFADFNYQNETFHFLPFEEYDYETLHSMEKDLLGINFRYHILHKYDTLVKEKHYTILSDALEAKSDNVNCVAVLANIKVIKTKKQEDMAFVELEDLFNSVEGVIFPKTYTRVEHTLKHNAVYHISGRKETRRNKQQLIIDQINRLEEA
jgi:DNA polymerase-3 subunit alpha